MSHRIDDVAVVVSSCDRFADVWPVFSALFDEYWPDCSYPSFILSNGKPFRHDRLQSLDVGPDRHWASNMKEALRRIDASVILYLQEDFLLTDLVDSERVRGYIATMGQRDAAYFRLVPAPPANQEIPGRLDYGAIRVGTPYRVALQCSLWRKDVLSDLLVDGESGWDMEFKGSARSNATGHEFLAVTGQMKHVAIPYDLDAIHRGKWRRHAISHCRRHGVAVDLEARPVHGLLYELYKRSPMSRLFAWSKSMRMRRDLGRVCVEHA